MCLTALGICKALPGLQEIPFSRLCHGRQADRHRASQAPGTEWGAVQDLPGMALSGCQEFESPAILVRHERTLPSSKEAQLADLAMSQAHSQLGTSHFPGSSKGSWFLCFQLRSAVPAKAESSATHVS